MKRKLWLVVGVTVLALLVASPVWAAKILRLGSIVSGKSLHYVALEKLAAHVKAATKGEYEIKLFPAMQLGNDPEMLQMLKMGTLDLCDGTNNTPVYLKEGRNYNATAAAYCFQGNAEYIKFLDSPVAKEMNDQLESGGLKVVGYVGDRTPRDLTTKNTPIKVPSDLKGLKLRLPGFKPLIEFFKACGAAPTAMSFSELFMALKTGTVDGQDNGIEIVYPYGFYDVQKYYMKTEHALGVYMVYGGQVTWNKWPESLKKAIVEGCRIAAEYNNKETDTFMANSFKKVQEKGMVVMDVDKPAFAAIGKSMWAKFDGDLWEKGYMDKIQKQLEALRK